MPVTISRTATMPSLVPISRMVTNHWTVTKLLSSLRSASSGQSPFPQLHHPKSCKYIYAPPLWPLFLQLNEALKSFSKSPLETSGVQLPCSVSLLE